MAPSMSSKCRATESLRFFSKPDFDPLMIEHGSIKIVNKLVHGSFRQGFHSFKKDFAAENMNCGFL